MTPNEFVRDPDRAAPVLEDALMCRADYVPRNRFDFGLHELGLGLQLKAIGFSVADTYVDGVFGYYAGVDHVTDKELVVVVDLFWKPIGYAEYASLDELKKHWELD